MSGFDLRRDASALLDDSWLRPGEQLREYAPSWSLARFDGIPKPYPTAGQAWAAVGRFIARIPLYLFVFWIVLLIAESGGDTGTGNRSRPAAIVWGDGLATRAGSLATPALRRRGIWAFTDRRVAFLGVRARTRSRLFSSNPVPGRTHEDYRSVPVETVAEFPEGEWRYEGTVERTLPTRIRKRAALIGTYHRIVFADGSGVDIRKRYQRG